MFHGMVRLKLIRFPPIVNQDEVKKGELEAVRHTVKAARLRGDEICNDLVYIYIYNTKPVYL